MDNNTSKKQFHFSNNMEEELNNLKKIRNDSKTSIATFANNMNQGGNTNIYESNKAYGQLSSLTKNSNEVEYLQDYQSSIATDMRIGNLERRLDSTEKMLRFYEEMFRLKEEENKNLIRIDQNKIIELNKKIVSLEENIKFLNKKMIEQNEIINEKLEITDKKLEKFYEVKNSIGDFYANKFASIEGLIKKNDILVENLVDDKISHIQINIDGRLEEMLNLINDIAKSTENNEFSISESKENIRIVQSEHLDFIKILSILKQKSDGLDYIMSQIIDLKNQYAKLINKYDNNTIEEEKFLQKVLGVNK